MSSADLDAELLAALFPPTVEAKEVSLLDFKKELRKACIGCFFSCGRLKLRGGSPQSRKRLYAILHERPDLEARIIIRIALNDPDVMDMIEERACIRWVEGYSDSLYLAVLGNITDTGENLEYSDIPDEKQAFFLRRMCIPEAQIMDKERSPSVWIKHKPRTDWNTELRRYR